MSGATVAVGRTGSVVRGLDSGRGWMYLAVVLAVAAVFLLALLLAQGLVLRPSTGATGPAGPAGANGAAGRNGTDGVPGPAGPGSTWGTLEFLFSVGGRGANLTVVGSACTLVDHGAYACNVTVSSTANFSQRIGGLAYAPSWSVYYAGADPTLGWIVVPAEGNVTFTLWFQEVPTVGSATVDVTLLASPLPRGGAG